MWLGSGIAVAVAEASSCRSNWTPSPGTYICHRHSHKKEKKKKVNIPPTPTPCPYNMCQNWSDKIVRIRLSLAHRCWTALESIFFTSYEGFPSLIPQKFAPSFIILEMLLLPHPGHFYFFLNFYLKKKKKSGHFSFLPPCLLLKRSPLSFLHFRHLLQIAIPSSEDHTSTESHIPGLLQPEAREHHPGKECHGLRVAGGTSAHRTAGLGGCPTSFLPSRSLISARPSFPSTHSPSCSLTARS